MKIGFIGTGSITHALVTGFCTCTQIPKQITVSPRNRGKATSLAKAFPQVKVAKSNQQVLDESDWVFLAILPDGASDILAPLSFREDHKVLSLLSGTKVDQVAQWISPAIQEPVRVIPMPFVTRHIGPIVIFPREENTAELLDPLGQIIPVGTEHELEMLAALSALMAPYYGLMDQIVKWGCKVNLNPEDAINYITSMFNALSVLAWEREDGKLEALMQESMTPGGLNELATDVIKARQGFTPWTDALTAVQERLAR